MNHSPICAATVPGSPALDAYYSYRLADAKRRKGKTDPKKPG